MLCGPTGIGKTWAAFAVANAVADLGFGDRIRVASEAELMGPQVATWQMEETFRRWVDGAALLLVDDIGVAARHRDQIQSGWKMLADLISAQPRSMLVVGTSNRQSWVKDSGLTDWMGQQAASRLRSWTAICTTGAVDRRTGDRHENWARQTSKPAGR
ncbi:AAA family ATPase [Dietzia sp. 179-F 9C3 NHS]|uniref:AAA family ATPase n=1 Tax=Dietzia sp. 179-F 9C3 NHS TaxID=3374295 RepID=UPI0038798A83